eukprot:TRINITY_DN39386_c0_g1_i1.p1 TRINITY_DN39386_c0_g1~~TRINITY_DN39386_c0_g1_i1.p1  ORF type:complete len:181 (+),score=30.57 TRINITY_DN39386_c0_g1_i1:38-544(+)
MAMPMPRRHRSWYASLVLAVSAIFTSGVSWVPSSTAIWHRTRLSIACRAGPEDGPPLLLTDENVEAVLEEARYYRLRNVFGYDKGSSDAGITGKVEFEGIEGPFVRVGLYGDFWHDKKDVMRRLQRYLIMRIPEIAEVDVSDPAMLSDERSEPDKTFYHSSEDDDDAQ